MKNLAIRCPLLQRLWWNFGSMTVFKNAKREVSALDKEFTNCIIAASLNACMNTVLTQVYNDKDFGWFSSRIWDSYECHMEKNGKPSLHAKKIDRVIVLGWCTKYIQAIDFIGNKPFKALATKKYDKWLAEEEINQETQAGTLNLFRMVVAKKPPSPCKFFQCNFYKRRNKPPKTSSLQVETCQCQCQSQII